MKLYFSTPTFDIEECDWRQ